MDHETAHSGASPDPTPRAGTDAAPGAPDDAESPQDSPTLVCELCGGPVLDRHCKIVCLNCGYQRDCSDP